MRILGKGKTGQAIQEIYKEASLFDDKNIDIYDKTSDEVTVVSPGIPPYNQLVKNTKNLISEYDLLKDTMPFTIWISGTNGKTTTTQMLQHLLSSYNSQCGGNIGVPLATMDRSKDIWILETSSFTLHYTKKAKPNIYVLLPVKEDHLSWHGSFKEYEKAKIKPLQFMSNEDIARSLQTGLTGMELTQYREEDESIPVLLRSTIADRQDLGKLENINVYAQATGDSVSLAQVADFELVWQPSVIIRRDGLKTVSVRVRPEQGVLASEIMATFSPWLDQAAKQWPAGYRFELGGDAEGSNDANDSISEQLPVAGIMILMLLIAQFNSIRRAGIIIATIPLMIVGVAFGLLVANSYFGFITMLGMISLAGIIINNAIVLIDQIDRQIKEKGDSAKDAIVNAALERFRPILLTTATTVLGLMPLWLGGSSLFDSMAIAMIFGLLFATLLTLGVVPVLYSILFKVSYR